MRRLKVFSLLLGMLFTMFFFSAPAVASTSGDINNFSYGVLTDTLNMSSGVNGTFDIAATNAVSMSSGIEHYGDILAGNGGVSLSSGVNEYGNVTAGNVGVSLTSGCTVSDNVTSSGPITVASGSTVDGSTKAHSSVSLPPSSVPTPVLSWYESNAANTFTGNETLSTIDTSQGNGNYLFGNNCIYYITGNLTCDSGGDVFAGKATTIVVGGTITISSGFNVSSSGALALIANKGISVSSGCNITNVLLWAGGNGGSNVSLSSGVSLTGDIVSPNSVTISSGVTINQEGTFPLTPPLDPGTPTVTAISPTSGPMTGGASVTVTGTNFTGATAVKFGSIAATNFTVNSTTQITATAPVGSAGTVDVTVTTPSGASATSSADKYAYIAPLTLTATGATLPNGTHGTSYASQTITYYVTASGGTGTGYAYNITNGLPVGLSFNATTGVISGTPTASGTYTLTVAVTDSASNTATCTLPLNVSKTALTVTANNATMTYGSTLPTFTVTYSGFVNGDTAASLGGALAFTPTTVSGAGTFPITPSGLTSNNYTITFVNGSLTVNKATLTVTANNQSMTYGGTVPTPLTYAITGFVNGDTQSVVSGSPSVTTTATSSSPVGSYTITAAAGTLSAANYTFTFVNGTLTVNKATLTVTAASASMAYGSTEPTFTATATGLVNGNTLTSLGLTFTTNPSIIGRAGTYAIVPSLTNGSNYNVNCVNGTLTVNPAITLTATSLPTGVVGDSYTSQAITAYITVSGGTGTGYTYGVASNTLPAGLSFTSSVISGTPQTAGNYGVSVTVTDSGNNIATCTLPLMVNPALSISGNPLPAGDWNVPYSQVLTNYITANGGTETGYSYNVTNGLPAGFSFDPTTNVISGNTTVDGSFNLTVQVTDSGNHTATCVITLIVQALKIGGIDHPQPGETIYGTNYKINGWYVDSNGVASILINITDQNGNTTPFPVILEDTSPTSHTSMPSQYLSLFPSAGFHCYINTTTLGDPAKSGAGAYTITLQETDDKGNIQTSQPETFYVYQPWLQ